MKDNMIVNEIREGEQIYIKTVTSPRLLPVLIRDFDVKEENNGTKT